MGLGLLPKIFGLFDISIYDWLGVVRVGTWGVGGWGGMGGVL